jgi:predicted transcriptional regulator of viral defense system
MEFAELLQLVGREPVFETGFLLAGERNPDSLRRRLTDWVRAGRLIQLRRGLYSLALPYQKTIPHPFLIANRLVPGSYVSLQAALAHYDLIPEYTPLVTSVTARRPGAWTTPFGELVYRVIRAEYLFGYERKAVAPEQAAYIATPEKALLDLVYLTPGGEKRAYLESLRLQNLEQLNPVKLIDMVDRMGKPKLGRAASVIQELASQEAASFVPL